MKRFQFRLQKLLEIREHKERLVKNELAKAERKKYIQVEKKDRMHAELDESRNKMKEEEKERLLSVERMKLYQRYFKRLGSGMKMQDKLIMIADEEIGLINEKLVEARKQRRILEKLKENKLKEYNYELQKEEQDFFDEVGNTNYIKEKSEKELQEKKETVKKKPFIPIKYREYEKNLTEKLYEELLRTGELSNDTSTK
ncbi:MAG: flagellar export protein FliJ [Spirochaetes bacterium]|nr:flagellar export protein FliJ [Spirochaetota bacterium]